MFVVKILFQLLVVGIVVLGAPALLTGFFYLSTAFIRWDLNLWDLAPDYWRALYWLFLVSFLALIFKKGVLDD